MTTPCDPTNPEDVFRSLCGTAEVAMAMRSSDLKSHAPSLDAIDEAAAGLVPSLLEGCRMAAHLYAAAKTLRPRIVEAFPVAPVGTYSPSTFSNTVRERLVGADASFLRLLHSRGFALNAIHHTLVLRALRKRDVPLQEFLIDSIADPMAADFSWLSKLRKRDHGRSGAFLSVFLHAAVKAHPAAAQNMMDRCFTSRSSLTFALLASAGVAHPTSRAAWIPTDLSKRITGLSRHDLLKLLPDGPDIASFWEDPEKIARIADFFAFRPDDAAA